MATRTETRTGFAPGFNMVRWSAVFAGVVISLAVFGLLTLLWQAAGFGSNVDWIADNIEWFIGGSAIFSMFLGGMLAAWIAGTYGPTQGVLHGLTVWGLLAIFSVILATPLLSLQGVGADTLQTVDDSARWTAFWSMLIGMGAAGLGGLFGGFLPHPPGARAGYRETDVREVDDRERVGERDRMTVRR